MSDDNDNLPEVRRETIDTEYEPTTVDKIRVRVRPVVAMLTSTQAKLTYATSAVLLIAIGVLYLSYIWTGLLDTIFYFVAFAAMAVGMPLAVMLLGWTIPFNGLWGNLHIILGQIAYGRGVLLQLPTRWEWVPAEKDRYWFDGEWYPIEGGQDNWTVLGWRPFGVIQHKTDETFEEYRVDGVEAAADGGTNTIRGGYEEAARPDVDGWLVDLKRLFSPGLKKIGDIELIEKAEEVIERGEIEDSVTEGWERVIAVISGLLIGVATGYFMM